MDTKVCKKCEKTFLKSEFPWKQKKYGWYKSICRECVNKNRVLLREQTKQKVFNHYGWRCVCCGETIKEFLTIDHTNNDGHHHRKNTTHYSGSQFYTWIVKNNYPKDLQVLCWNCNCAKGIYGKCPHNN